MGLGGVTDLKNYVSTDNGATWTLDGVISGAQTNVDKQMVWIDHNPASPFFNQQYAIWHNGTPAFMNRRTAGVGGTWLAAPIQVSGAESTGTSIGGDVKTNSAGEVRDGGSYEDRFSKVGVWNCLMNEAEYQYAKWNEFSAA